MTFPLEQERQGWGIAWRRVVVGAKWSRHDRELGELEIRRLDLQVVRRRFGCRDLETAATERV